ncbi:hypothetical protein MNBD_ALPHA09-317 [hydrothermal vent metagenome]|uniref:VCBS repeat-containing protein n=1 Tax=hydrothermal vent metagenome TaxID=652676 RepID=A0A3B0TEC5_9ZZZZ
MAGRRQGMGGSLAALWPIGVFIAHGAFAAATDPPRRAASEILPPQSTTPIVGIDGEQISCFLGGVGGGEFLNAKALAARLRGPTEYRLYNLAGDGGVAVAPGPPVDEGSEGECADLWRHDLALDPRRAGKPFAALRSSSVNANPLPKTLESLEAPAPEHIELVRNFLLRRNISDPEVKIIQSVRTDLDGDGIDDWLLNAVRRQPDIAAKGDYSIVLVLRGLKQGFRTYIIHDDITLEDSPYPSTLWVNEIVAVLDVDGDGAMEVVMNGAYIYGGGWDLIRFQNGAFEYVLFCGCDG